MATGMEVKEQISDDKRNIFVVNINDKRALYKVFMPFVSEGGLFIRTEKKLKLHDEVYLLVTLLDEPDKYSISGKVIWVTPSIAQGGRQAGIGIQFSGEDAEKVKDKIEGFLAGSNFTNEHTDTM
jgi:type IV pilus assembly protein PilZ